MERKSSVPPHPKFFKDRATSQVVSSSLKQDRGSLQGEKAQSMLLHRSKAAPLQLPILELTHQNSLSNIQRNFEESDPLVPQLPESDYGLAML